MNLIVSFAITCVIHVSSASPGTLREMMQFYVMDYHHANVTLYIIGNALLDREDNEFNTEAIDTISRLYGAQAAKQHNLGGTFWITFKEFMNEFTLRSMFPPDQRALLSERLDRINAGILRRFTRKHVSHGVVPATEDELSAVYTILSIGHCMRDTGRTVLKIQGSDLTAAELRNISHHVHLIEIFSEQFPNISLPEVNRRMKDLSQYDIQYDIGTNSARRREAVQGSRALSISRSQFLQIATQFMCGYCNNNNVNMSRSALHVSIGSVPNGKLFAQIERLMYFLLVEEREDLLLKLFDALGAENVEGMIAEMRLGHNILY